MSITSQPYRPSANVCCEACAFGGDEHADWCRFVTLLCPRCAFTRLRFDKGADPSRERSTCALCGAEFALRCPDPISVEVVGWVSALRNMGIDS